MLNKLPPEIIGFMLAAGIAFMRVMLDAGERRPLRIILEALICGCLAVTAFYGVRAMGLNLDWAVFAGGLIGNFGSTAVHMFAYRYFLKRIDKEKERLP